MASIPIAKPLFGEEEAEWMRKPLETGWVVQGPFVAEFERRFAAFVGVPHAAATSSATTALHLAMRAMNVGSGDEVIVPSFTWIATPNAVEYTGATARFCDIDLATFNMDPASLERAITPRTRGIIAVHLFGLCADWAAIRAIADRHGLWIVEDAACAFGATAGGRQAGTLGELACFSFHPRKSITTGEGGMVTSSNGEAISIVRSLRDHGVTRHRSPSHPPYLLADYDSLGYNYRMTDFQGALGCAQMDRAASILELRRERARRYDAMLADVPGLRTPYVPAGMEHGYQAYVCTVAPEEPSLANVARLEETRNAVMAALEAKGITTRQGTHAPVLASYYRDRYALRAEEFPNAVLAEKLSLAIPLYPQMTDEEQAYVCDALREAMGC